MVDPLVSVQNWRDSTVREYIFYLNYYYGWSTLILNRLSIFHAFCHILYILTYKLFVIDDNNLIRCYVRLHSYGFLLSYFH